MSDIRSSKKYLQRYKDAWEQESVFQGWLQKCPNPYEARCKFCNVVINVRYGKDGLRRHADSAKHLKSSVKDEVGDNFKSEEMPTLDSSNELWGFYDRESGNVAQCSMCPVKVPCDPDIMYQHLKDAHSNVSKHLQPNDQDGMFTEVIYLEDQQLEREESRRKRREISDVKKSSVKVESDRSLEDFGKYVMSLMKGVPLDVCVQLQADIVNMIMKAKGDDEKEVSMDMEESTDQIEETSTNIEDSIPIERKRIKAPDKFTKAQRHPHNDNGATDFHENITNFGKYLMSMMKCLSKDTNVEIQSDIVKMIVAAKLKHLRTTRNSFMEIQNKVLVDTVG